MNNYSNISIIVPVYNGGKCFRDCVSSLITIDFPSKYMQVVLINDGSTDDTSQWLNKQKLPDNFKIITHNKNKGRAAARNSGIKNAQGDIIIFLDADMIVASDFVKQHIKTISTPGVVAVVGNLIAEPNKRRTTLQKYLFDYKWRGAKRFGENNPISFKYLTTGNMSIKHQVATECGLFDEDYIGYGSEDTDYAIRLYELYPNGLRFSSKATSIHCHDENLIDILTKIRKYGSTNYLRLLKNHPNHADDLAGNWINSIPGKLLFNRLFFCLIKTVYFVIPTPLFIRYFIAYNMITGARNPADGIPKYEK